MDDAERSRWRETWRATLCEIATPAGWRGLRQPDLPDPALVVTAWNPAGRRLPGEVNAARDAVLRAEFAARGTPAWRARGRSPDGSWHEDGWLVAYPAEAGHKTMPIRVPLLLRRYGQLAAFVFSRGGRALAWDDGVFEWLEPPEA